MKNFHKNIMAKFIKNAVVTTAWLIIYAGRMKSWRIQRDLINEVCTSNLQKFQCFQDYHGIIFFFKWAERKFTEPEVN